MRVRRLGVISFGTAVLAGALVATAAPASAAYGNIGERETVCAEDLFFRSGPGNGAWDGVLVRGQTFRVESRHGDSVYGFAYGNINRKGYVKDGWFC